MPSAAVARNPSDYSATHTSTAFCTHWPKFSLVNFNNLEAHRVDGQLRNTYGLSSLPKNANATVVMLGFSDSQDSMLVAKQITQMKSELESFSSNLKINTVWLNNAMPLKCAQRKCTSTSGNCDEWYGGCPPNADELKAENWQHLATEAFPGMAVFQDTKDKQIWRKFGGGKDDMLIYDQSGLLYSYGCSKETCLNGEAGFDSRVTDPLGYQNIKSLIHLAANTNGALRCQPGSQCSITRQLAPEGYLDNEYVDIIVVAILVVTGIILGVMVPKMWARIQETFCSTTAVARDRFIQLSTVDNDILNDEEDPENMW